VRPVIEGRAAAGGQSLWSRAADLLREELSPYPGRFEDSLRIAVLAVLTVIISETLQVPLIAYSTYIVFFTSKEDSATTFAMGMVCTIAASSSVLLSEAAYAISVGEPAIRISLMVLGTFAGLFFWRASPFGPVAFPTSFVFVMALSLGDFIGPTDRLTAVENLSQLVLWLWSVAMLPISLVVVANLLTGRSPVRLIRNELSSRLDACGCVLAAGADVKPRDAARLLALLRAGPARSVAAVKMIGAFDKRLGREKDIWRRSIALVERLVCVAAEWGKLDRRNPELAAGATEIGEYLLSAARSLGKGTALPPVPDMSTAVRAVQNNGDAGMGRHLLAQIAALSDSLRCVRCSVSTGAPEPATVGRSGGSTRQLFLPDAFTNPDYCRYALKGTLAIFLTYLGMSAVAWPGIRTCMITAFFVAVGSSGETSHKITLRMIGALIGCGLGLVSVLFIMPYMTTIAQLALMIGVVAFMAAWISMSGERLSYAGLQIAMAFFFATLVGYAPSIDHIEARDRVIGILFGITTVFVVFSSIWPVSVLANVRERLAGALEKLSKVLKLVAEGSAGGQEQMDDLVIELSADLARAWRVSFLDHFETGTGRQSGRTKVTATLVDSLRDLLGPLAVLACGPAGATGLNDYDRSLAEWLSLVAQHFCSPTAEQTPLPAYDVVLPVQIVAIDQPASSRADWCRAMDSRIREFARQLRECAPAPTIQSDGRALG
jgi:multidrug resistance protein MdtO